MNDGTVRFLLPWYVNGTLEKKESLEIEAVLAKSATMRQDLQNLRSIASALKNEQHYTQRKQIAWRRLLAQIHQAPKKRKPANNHTNHWRWFYATAATVIISLQASMLVLEPAQTTPITPLSGPLAFSPGDTVIQVELSPQMTVQALNTLLSRINGQLMAGPSELGIYRIRITKPKTSEINSQHDVAEMIRLLQQHAGVLHAAEDNE